MNKSDIVIVILVVFALYICYILHLNDRSTVSESDLTLRFSCNFFFPYVWSVDPTRT